jgi:hypothetical protein
VEDLEPLQNNVREPYRVIHHPVGCLVEARPHASGVSQVINSTPVKTGASIKPKKRSRVTTPGSDDARVRNEMRAGYRRSAVLVFLPAQAL